MSTRDTPWPAGTPCWVDYSAPDLEAAKAFYADLFGWTYSGGDPEYGGYLTCELNGRAAAGMAPQTDPGSAGWTTYFAAADAAATAARIDAAGGTVVVPPMQVGPMGTMAIATDPQSNVFGLWQAGLNTGVQISGEPGALVWNEASVDDVATAQTFYSHVFGFHFDEVEGAGGYSTFGLGERPLGGLGGPAEGAPRGWSTCFAVASADDTVAAVTAAGGTVTMPAMTTPWGRFAVLDDPWGQSFEVMEDLGEG